MLSLTDVLRLSFQIPFIRKTFTPTDTQSSSQSYERKDVVHSTSHNSSLLTGNLQHLQIDDIEHRIRDSILPPEGEPESLIQIRIMQATQWYRIMYTMHNCHRAPETAVMIMADFLSREYGYAVVKQQEQE